ncbi:bifunctional diguanylate cyclase/phosphodiesterase [Mycobacterium sp. NPDC006124]|uniref:putative bifunctional diguanylate cyclase/phosphodiesterase n=1 Tax=Mycobacterium sp. NPDC006124 TaxID=3156729 RepID=UPI0033BC849E
MSAARSFNGRRRLAWSMTAAGVACWVFGDLVWAYYRIVQGANPPFPSIADAAFLLLPVAVCVSWIVNTSGPRLVSGIRPLLDGLIVASSVFVVSWVAALRTLPFTSGPGGIQLLTALLYPVADVILLTMAIIITATLPAAHRLATGLFTAGLTVIAISDTLGAFFSIHGGRIGNGLVIGWSTGIVLIGAAALAATSAPALQTPGHPGRTSKFPFWLPYVPTAVATVVGVVFLWSGHTDHPMLVAGFLMIVVTLIRQFMVLLDNRRLTATIAEQALRDPLTGLANRLLFTDRLGHAMQLWERDRSSLAILSLDLDDFKLVNDNLGHPQGDALLKLVAERLRSVVPAENTLARLGGDEFAVLVEGDPCPRDIAQRVVEAFDKPFFLGGEEVYIHPSVGLAIATSSAGDDQPISADELFHRADLAMYTAKRAGVGGVQCFTNDMRHVEVAELRTALGKESRRRDTPLAGIALLGQLRRAIDDDALSLVYQPKISLSSAAIVGVEALIRWPHPEHGLLTPNQFLPLVRRNGLMGAVTDLVIDRAVSDATSWYDPVDCAIPVAINLFAPSLGDLSFPERIGAALDRASLPAHALSVEITEHLLLGNVSRASTVIQRLRAIGLGIAIDDFGSGYSTMSYLRDLHVDELKLDRQFIAPIVRSERAAAIVRSVIDLAHTLGIVCVAEGVEDRATAIQLADDGCDVAQGHYFARPMTAPSLREALHDNRWAVLPAT